MHPYIHIATSVASLYLPFIYSRDGFIWRRRRDHNVGIQKTAVMKTEATLKQPQRCQSRLTGRKECRYTTLKQSVFTDFTTKCQSKGGNKSQKRKRESLIHTAAKRRRDFTPASHCLVSEVLLPSADTLQRPKPIYGTYTVQIQA